MKKYVIVVALLVMLSVTLSATAFMSKSITRENGVSAYAYWDKTSTESYEYTNLGVMKTDRGTDIYVYTCKYDLVDLEWIGNCRDGYAFTTEDIFNVDKKLKSATLSTVDVNMYDWNTNTVIMYSTEMQKSQPRWMEMTLEPAAMLRSISSRMPICHWKSKREPLIFLFFFFCQKSIMDYLFIHQDH